MDINDVAKIDNGNEWLTRLAGNIASKTHMILLRDLTLIDPSEISSMSFIGHFKEGSKGSGAVDLTIQLKGGGKLEITGLARERITSFTEAYLAYVDSRNASTATKFINQR